MKSFRLVATALSLSCLSSPAFAGDKWVVQPIQVGAETVRYEKGMPTLDLELNDGVVQVTPLPLDHGSLSFGVAVYNDSRRPANFGIEHVSVTHEETDVAVFTRDQLASKAKNRAMWSQIGIGVLGGLAAGAAASQRNYYHSSFVTRRGTYRSYWSGPSLAGQIQAAELTAATGVGIALVQRQLDNTLVALGDEIVQLTTIDPGESYAGRIVAAKVKPKKLPATVELTVNWNGEAYPFTFRIAKPGTPAPPFNALTRKSDLTDFRPAPAQPPVAPAALQRASITSPAPRQSLPAKPPEIMIGGLKRGARVRCVTCH